MIPSAWGCTRKSVSALSSSPCFVISCNGLLKVQSRRLTASWVNTVKCIFLPVVLRGNDLSTFPQSKSNFTEQQQIWDFGYSCFLFVSIFTLNYIGSTTWVKYLPLRSPQVCAKLSNPSFTAHDIPKKLHVLSRIFGFLSLQNPPVMLHGTEGGWQKRKIGDSRWFFFGSC